MSGYHTINWLDGQRHPLPPAGSRVLIAREGRAYFGTVKDHDRVLLDGASNNPKAPGAWLIVRPGSDTSWWWSYAPAIPGG